MNAESENISYAVEMLHITKAFFGIKVNDDITLKLKHSEIHALLGENGSGKSTLMKILFGLYRADSGKVLINGKKSNINSPIDATKYGIGMVHQHFKLVDSFTVLDNIILGAEATKLGLIDRKLAEKKVYELSEKYGLKVTLSEKIENISIGMQQRTEILKMLYRDNEILIFDEPTAVLTPQEIKEFMNIMKTLKNEGKSIIFITHKLREIMEVADRCTVLRKGKSIGTVEVSDADPEDLSKLMVGHTVKWFVDKKEIKRNDIIFEVKNIIVKNKSYKKNIVNDVSFKIYNGEIVGIVGIDNSGQDELINAIVGMKHLDSGQVIFKGKDITKYSIRQKNKIGIGYIPADRHKDGLILDYTLEQNLILREYYNKKYQNSSFINFSNVRKHSDCLSKEYDIRSLDGAISNASYLSGGNQQKAVIAREMSTYSDLLIAVQPTRGLDISATTFINQKLIDIRNEGKSVLLVSFELDEVMNLSDRILVMHNGEIVGEFKSNEIDKNEIGLYMTGIKKQKKVETI